MMPPNLPSAPIDLALHQVSNVKASNSSMPNIPNILKAALVVVWERGWGDTRSLGVINEDRHNPVGWPMSSKEHGQNSQETIANKLLHTGRWASYQTDSILQVNMNQWNEKPRENECFDDVVLQDLASDSSYEGL